MSRIYTLLFVLFGFVIFNAENVGQAVSDLGGMIGVGGLPLISDETLYNLRSFGIVLLAGGIGATPVVRNLAGKVSEHPAGDRILEFVEPVGLAVLMLVMTAYLVDGSFQAFLYFRF